MVKSCKFNTNTNSDKVLAFVDITFDNGLTVYGAKIVEGSNGPFIGMPQRKGGDKYYDIVRASKEASQQLTDEVMEMFENNGKSAPKPNAPSGKKSIFDRR